MADPDPEQSIHVLLLPNPSQGHINPILQFGKRLAAHRDVRCTTGAGEHSTTAGGVAGGGVHVATVSDGCDAGGFDEAGGIVAYTARLEAAGSETVGALLRSKAELGRPRVARWHGVASAAFFTQPCAVDVAYGPALAGLLDTPLVGEMTPPIDLPGLPGGLRLCDMPTFLTDQGDDRAYLDLLVNQFSGLDTADHVLVNSFYELQAQESEYMASTWRAKTVGPTVPSAYLDKRLPDDTSYGFHLYTPLTAVTRAWLDARPARSVVYVSFGSLAKPNLVQMAEMAEGLYNSGKNFLWGLVLAHPAIGCSMMHCGWNSTMEGMGAGVPMVAMPQWSDQTMNAKYIEDMWRVGVRVCPDENGVVRKEEVERCVREVMVGEKSAEYRRNVTDWKEKAKSAMSVGGSSDNNIIQFLRKLGLKSA
ncbi:hypothetical protein HU200_033789 [Digitaria exilis]|uniref:Glycosyltransferase n=1 Tax=Digitaria exilis TaxID=1010633 RepID=A0A835ER13_9POAL|nr:hypothetical protein HU200_033789 [Digitaria exilis]